MLAPPNAKYPLWGLLAALAGFAALQAVAFWHAGVLEYPLDDVYIHLAMAEKIAGGTYGVNAGEPASASSSILFPLLLLPFPGTEAQRLLPLFWNTLAVAGCGWTWGRIVQEARLAGIAGGFIALAAPMAVNISGVGFLGMEAAPHMLASLLIVLGLWRAFTGRGVAPWLVAAAIAAPLLRYEGLALSLLAAAALFLHGDRRPAIVIAALSAGAVVAFSLFLMALGLDPVPGSVLAKTAGLNSIDSLPLRLALGALNNMTKAAGAILAALILAAALLPVTFPGLRRGPGFWLLLVTALAGLAHLCLGQVGWLHRYEPYILLSLIAAILLASTALAPRAAWFTRAIATTAVLAAGAAYLPALWGTYVWNPRALHLQQAQMARFAQEYLRAPVIVNDLGRVTWGNPDHVLDIWGLGSAETREIRFSDPPPPDGWAGPLAAEHGIRVAMIYDFWFATAVGPDWVRVGKLTMNAPKGALGSWTVSFYATDPAFAPDLRGRLAAFAPTLPEEARLTLEGGA